VGALAAEDRKALGRLGVTIGRLVVFLPALGGPAARRLGARLFAIHNSLPPEVGPEGIPSAANDPSRPAGFFLACGYFPAGPRVVRLDRLERSAAVLARLSRTGRFVPPRELPGILGCLESELAAVLGALGYVPVAGQFERRPPSRAKRPEALAPRRFRSR
jgi:ATP-dependent RNA helicase SUPV3L1/SUV3